MGLCEEHLKEHAARPKPEPESSPSSLIIRHGQIDLRPPRLGDKERGRKFDKGSLIAKVLKERGPMGLARLLAQERRDGRTLAYLAKRFETSITSVARFLHLLTDLHPHVQEMLESENGEPPQLRTNLGVLLMLLKDSPRDQIALAHVFCDEEITTAEAIIQVKRRSRGLQVPKGLGF